MEGGCFVLKYDKKVLYITIGVLLFFPIILFSLYLYEDICLTTMHGLTVWYTIFDGYSLCDFYAIPYPLNTNPAYAYYDFFIYIIFAIWNIPLFVFEKITNVSFMDHYITRLYAKTIILFFLVLASVQVKKLTMKVCNDENKSNWSVFVFIFSITVFQTIFVIGGYDIISVFFTLVGINSYLDKKNKKFVVSFACAIACKMFAAWIFIPLVLLRKKKISHIFLYGIGGISVIAIPKVIFKIHTLVNGKLTAFSEFGPGEVSNMDLINDFLWSGEAPITIPSIPLLFFCYFIIWVWCWFEKEERKNAEVVYISLISIAVFFLTANTYPYWLILVSPYIAVLICYNWTEVSKTLFLEACFGIGYIFTKVFSSPQCYHYNLIVQMLKNEEFSMDFYYIGLYNILNKLANLMSITSDSFRTLARSVYGASFILLIYYLRPKLESKDDILIDNKKYFYWKAACCIFVSCIPVLGFVIRKVIY